MAAWSAGSEPHLLILDGVERVQSEGKADRARGELEDHQLKNLLRSMASGVGRTRALVTSRFALTDLEPWEGAGHRTHRLDVLAAAAVSVLQAWGVRGDTAPLRALAEQVGYHALSVSVLGSYLYHFCDGDPAGAASLDLQDVGADDPQAARLGRILAGYARDLPGAERDLLIRLSVFPRGVAVEVLGYLVEAGGDIAGTLVGASQAQLARLAERLRQRGLVFAYTLRQSMTYTAHPFLRDYFRALLGVPAEGIHEAVRTRLAPGLDTRPDTKPREAEMLDRYEALIEHSLLAGRVEEAHELSRYGLGHYEHLGRILGEYTSGARIAASFAADGEPRHIAPQLSPRDRSFLVTDWGLHAKDLGDVALAARCFEVGNDLEREASDWRNLSAVLQCSAEVALLRGAFLMARELATEALDRAEAAADDRMR